MSNSITPTYNLSECLSKLLAPLRESQYSIKDTKDFMNKIKSGKVPNRYQMVSFDVKSLFTNVLLYRTIQLVLIRIYEKREVSTNITKQEMKEMLILCAKNGHFTLNEGVYKQADGKAMGSPLGSFLANIFMVELVNTIAPVLR